MKRIRSSGGRRLGKQDRRQLRVLYQDDAIVVLNKPAKMLAVPTDDSDLPSALSLLSAELNSKRQRAFVVHRIDRHTSGILLFAKTWPDREALVQQFIRHAPVREYLAAVRAHLRLKEGTLVHYLRQAGMFHKVTTERDPNRLALNFAIPWNIALRAHRSPESRW
jgi:23S rRNA pseudouridine1911/1915/1917 synthase